MYRDATLSLKFSVGGRFDVCAALDRAWVCVRGWREIHRQRRALLSLDDAMLKDIGLSRVDALQEGNKPFWRS